MTDRRWGTALLFLGLSTAAYVVPTALALLLFYQNLTNALDIELQEFMASFGHAITLDQGKPQFRDWSRIVETEPARSLITYQLFDSNRKVLEVHGQPGIDRLFLKDHEIREGARNMRTFMTPLKNDSGEILGYLQIQLSTRARDEAVRQLAEVTLLVAPMVLLGLAYCSFLVSERATASVKEVNIRLRNFMADASHELYTPLGIFEAALESAQKELSGDKRGQAEIEIAVSAIGRMEKILEDLMFLSTIENQSIDPVREPIVLRNIVEKTALEFRPKFEQKNISLDLALDAGVDGHTLGDASAIERLISNLVENALRYTDNGGRVEIGLTREGNSLKVTVADSGIGIPAESLEKIFERFYRVDRSRSRETGGSGLGLAIAMAIAKNHNGTIEVHENRPNGTVFTMILPEVP